MKPLGTNIKGIQKWVRDAQHPKPKRVKIAKEKHLLFKKTGV